MTPASGRWAPLNSGPGPSSYSTTTAASATTRSPAPRGRDGHQSPATSTGRDTSSSRRTTTSGSSATAQPGRLMKKCQPRSLTPFLDGELTEDAWQETEEHLQGCPSCSAQLDELTAASQHVRGMGRATIPQSALRAAVDIIAPRVGLTPETMLAETTEIARAKAVEPAVPPLPGALGPSAPISDDLAWTPMRAP